MAINSKIKAVWREADVTYTWQGICLQERRISYQEGNGLAEIRTGHLHTVVPPH